MGWIPLLVCLWLGGSVVFVAGVMLVHTLLEWRRSGTVAVRTPPPEGAPSTDRPPSARITPSGGGEAPVDDTAPRVPHDVALPGHPDRRRSGNQRPLSERPLWRRVH